MKIDIKQLRIGQTVYLKETNEAIEIAGLQKLSEHNAKISYVEQECYTLKTVRVDKITLLPPKEPEVVRTYRIFDLKKKQVFNDYYCIQEYIEEKYNNERYMYELIDEVTLPWWETPSN